MRGKLRIYELKAPLAGIFKSGWAKSDARRHFGAFIADS